MSHAERLNKQWDVMKTSRSWRDLKPTEKQKSFLEKYNEDIPKTRGKACDMIGEIIECLNELPIAPWGEEDPHWGDHR